MYIRSNKTHLSNVVFAKSIREKIGFPKLNLLNWFSELDSLIFWGATYVPYFVSYISHRINTIMSRFDVFSPQMTSFRIQIVMRFFYSKICVIILGVKLFFTLNISLASIWNVRCYIITELSSSKRSLKVSPLSLYTSLKAFSCILLIRLSNCLL